MSGLIRPKIEFDRAFTPVLVTSNFDDDSIKNERICVFTQLKQREYAIKLICVRTKTQTKLEGTQCKKFQKCKIRILSIYANIAVSNCKQLLSTNFNEKTDKV